MQINKQNSHQMDNCNVTTISSDRCFVYDEEKKTISFHPQMFLLKLVFFFFSLRANDCVNVVRKKNLL